MPAMCARQRILRAAVVGCAVLCTWPALALASNTEESILMDDGNLVYAEPSHVVSTLEQLKALGVDRVKVSVVWSIIAPHSRSTHRPKFNASDPGAYPGHVWDRYDLVVRTAHALGLGVYFELNPPAPAWATPTHKPSQGYSWSQEPSTRDYEQFVEAVGRRYSGTYTIPGNQAEPSQSLLGLSVPIPGITRPPANPSAAVVIPRIDYWGLWNEPNEAAWLNPQWDHVSSTVTILKAPALYRGLVDVAWTALHATGHGGDTILIGETASRGWILPTPFVQALYCVGPRLRPLTGTAATDASCPTSGNRADFVAKNPGLFDATGYAHHPYSFDVPPSAKPPFPGEVTLSKLGAFEGTLEGIFSAYGRSHAGGIPLYLTEWGYKTNPPNPFVHTSLAEQARWLNQGEYMTYNDPYVRALTQFLLTDDPPNKGFKPGTRQYWSTPDTGLLNIDGSPKPAFGAFRIPIWLPSTRHGSRVTVWGELRPADHSTNQAAVIEYRDGTTGKWTSVAVQTSNPEGFLVAHVSLPARGKIRIAWYDPATRAVYHSRTVGIG